MRVDALRFKSALRESRKRAEAMGRSNAISPEGG
jgi:hypothetical protein